MRKVPVEQSGTLDLIGFVNLQAAKVKADRGCPRFVRCDVGGGLYRMSRR